MNIHIDIILAGFCMGAVVSSNDKITAPILRALPDYPIYYKGESVTLTCNTDRKYRRARFTFYKNSEYIQNNDAYIYKIYGMDYSDVGIYACEFWAGSHSSPRSNEISLFVHDRLPPPLISLNSSRSVFTMGGPVAIVCSPPRSLEVKGIQFYKEGNVHPLKETEKNTYVISTYTKEVDGRYSCTYTLEIQMRLMTSLSSEYIVLNVSAAQTTAATIIPKSPALDTTRKTWPTGTFSPTQSPKVTQSTTESRAGTSASQLPAAGTEGKTQTTETFIPTSSLKILIFVFAGGLIFIIIFVLIQGLVRICIQRNGKKEAIMVEPPVPESDMHSVHNLKTIVQPSPLQEMETEHFYSEIELPIVKASSPIVSFYTTAKAIDPLPPVYCTDLATHAKN